jgi:DNA-binding transcriptional ArsR family regulator
VSDPAGAVFGALADPTRRFVVRCLAEGGPVTATELADRLPITRQAVAKHLSALYEAGLVQRSKEGRETRYRLTPDPFTDAVAWMTEVGAGWERRLNALRSHLDSRSGSQFRGSSPGTASQNEGKGALGKKGVRARPRRG